MGDVVEIHADDEIAMFLNGAKLGVAYGPTDAKGGIAAWDLPKDLKWYPAVSLQPNDAVEIVKPQLTPQPVPKLSDFFPLVISFLLYVILSFSQQTNNAIDVETITGTKM